MVGVVVGGRWVGGGGGCHSPPVCLLFGAVYWSLQPRVFRHLTSLLSVLAIMALYLKDLKQLSKPMQASCHLTPHEIKITDNENTTQTYPSRKCISSWRLKKVCSICSDLKVITYHLQSWKCCYVKRSRHIAVSQLVELFHTIDTSRHVVHHVLL